MSGLEEVSEQMTLKKYLSGVAKLFDVKRRKCEKEKHCLRVALKKLKVRKKALESDLGQADRDKERDDIKRQLKVIQAQRHKGLKLLKELKNK